MSNSEKKISFLCNYLFTFETYWVFTVTDLNLVLVKFILCKRTFLLYFPCNINYMYLCFSAIFGLVLSLLFLCSLIFNLQFNLKVLYCLAWPIKLSIVYYLIYDWAAVFVSCIVLLFMFISEHCFGSDCYCTYHDIVFHQHS